MLRGSCQVSYFFSTAEKMCKTDTENRPGHAPHTPHSPTAASTGNPAL